MAQWSATRSSEEGFALCAEYGVPAGPVLTPQQALEDPQVEAMGDLHQIDIPGAPVAAPIMGPPFRLSKTPGPVRHRAPLLGEHPDEVLRSLGFSAVLLEALRNARII
jgi:crotonobetainyl-CoA:carnitine CoA-transferase CaiB-like acyl-CoA transferase